MKDRLGRKRNENVDLKKTIQENEVQIEDINKEIQKLNEEIEALKKRNDGGIHNLERDRNQAVADLEALRKQATQTEHEYNKLKILVEKTKNEIEYLNSEKKGSDSSKGYHSKVQAFKRTIAKCDTKTQELRSELDNVHKGMNDQVARSTRDSNLVARSSQSQGASKMI